MLAADFAVCPPSSAIPRRQSDPNGIQSERFPTYRRTVSSVSLMRLSAICVQPRAGEEHPSVGLEVEQEREEEREGNEDFCTCRAAARPDKHIQDK